MHAIPPPGGKPSVLHRPSARATDPQVGFSPPAPTSNPSGTAWATPRIQTTPRPVASREQGPLAGAPKETVDAAVAALRRGVCELPRLPSSSRGRHRLARVSPPLTSGLLDRPPPDDLPVRSVAFPRLHLSDSGRWCQDAPLLPWGVVATHSSGAPIQLGIDDPSWGSLAPAPARARGRRRMSATACRWTRVQGPRVRPSPGGYRARATPPARHPRGDDVPSRHGWRTPRGTASPSPGWQSR